ncbi:AAA family ATPase [Devosia sp.]|uniref:AAA family ATPase n=1 Tax=Devosia sp. TaxID=1871048 RepID=UPI003A938018
MKLTALRLHNVRRFGGQGVAIENIGDGVNVLTAANEHGKSTAFEALHALFFQPHTGTANAVRQLRPYSGGNPLIEADIETADGRYRLTKQFFGGKRASVRDLVSGRLIAQADEAENFISELTRGGSAGPAGLLWVRQGLTGMERQTNAELESDKRVRETLLTSVQGEVEALTGGRRMTEILAACEEELGKLVTATGRPKSGGRYAAKLEEAAALETAEAELAAKVSSLREALDQRRQARSRLAEIDKPDEQAARRAAITAAETAFEAARRHADALKSAEAEAALARNHRDSAAKALDDFKAAEQRDAALQTELTGLQSRRDAALARRTEATTAADAARAAIAAAEAEEREQRDLLTRLDAALRARDASERLTALKAQLATAETARADVEAHDAALAALSISDKAIATLQATEANLQRLRATQQASLPTLRVDYAPGTTGTVSLGDTLLEDGRELGFTDTATLEIAGVGRITLRSNRPPEAGAEIAAAEAQLRDQFAALGVDSLAAALQRRTEAQTRTAARDLARQRLADLAPRGIAALQAEIARLTEQSAGALELKGDPVAARAALEAATDRVATTRNSARELEPQLAQAGAALLEAETAYARIASEAASLDAQLGPSADRPARRAQLETEHANRATAFAAAEARAAELRPLAHDLAAADATLKRLRSVDAAAAQEAAQLRETLAVLNGTINAQAESAVEEAWQETRETLSTARAAVTRFETEIAVLTRLRAELTSARSAARDLYLKPVVTELLPLLNLLFDDIAITFDETTLLPHTVRRNGLDEEVDRLSGGMREQLSILTRLAFASLLARDGRPAPVILDDALVYSDDDRIERMFNALHQRARDQQILVFSCRQRAFAQLGGNVLRLQPWTPPDA